MDPDEVWRTTDENRLRLADLFDSFDAEDWEVPSLCTAWRVREVAAHLTQAQAGVREALPAMLRAGGNVNRMIRDMAIRQARRPVETYAPRLRLMLGSRKKAPGVSLIEPMLDSFVHEQDMLRPLGRTRAIPPEPAATAAQRAWSMGFPFHAAKRLDGFRLVATDHSWTAGEGLDVEAPVGDLLLLVTGRDVVLPDLGGPGADRLRERLSLAG